MPRQILEIIISILHSFEPTSYSFNIPILCFSVPHVSILDAVVYEDEGEVKINVTRTGGDLSLRTTIFASTRDATGK